MFSVSLNFQNKNQKQPLFPTQSLGSLREVNTSSPHIFLDFPPANWRWYLLLLNLPHSTCLARMLYTCSVSARIHQSIWQLTYCSSQDGRGMLVTWALFSSGVTAAVGSPEKDRFLLLFLLVGKKSEGNRREMFLYTQKLRFDSSAKKRTVN